MTALHILTQLGETAVQKTFKKNDYLIKEGDIERNIFFIHSGAVRVFRITDQEDQTIRFGYKGNIITSISSFFTATPSEFFIEALRKTVVSIVSKEKFYEFVQADPQHLNAYNTILENLIVQQMEREIDLLTHSPVERLFRVVNRSTQLFQEIPLKYIASYLRMTPETLSRIKKS
jgi:CRP/FNR family transcriptional regulator, anaerobic regulatory protein